MKKLEAIFDAQEGQGKRVHIRASLQFDEPSNDERKTKKSHCFCRRAAAGPANEDEPPLPDEALALAGALLSKVRPHAMHAGMRQPALIPIPVVHMQILSRVV